MAEVSQGVILLVSAVLVLAAVIDGRQLRVPNWLVFPFIAGGLAYHAGADGSWGFLKSLEGAALGLVFLVVLHSLGGMGAGDVKLLAGVGAWMGPTVTMWAFLATGLAGGVIALAMMVLSGDLVGHLAMMQTIAHEILSIRNFARWAEVAELAKARKSQMMLLPYGIPIAVGSISYFAISCLSGMGLFF